VPNIQVKGHFVRKLLSGNTHTHTLTRPSAQHGHYILLISNKYDVDNS